MHLLTPHRKSSIIVKALKQAVKRNAVKFRSSPRCREEAALLSQTETSGHWRDTSGKARHSVKEHRLYDSKPEDLPLGMSKFVI